MGKLGMVCIYPYPNMLAVVCCGISRVGAKHSMEVRLRKWFTSWVEGFDIDVPPADGPLVCGLV
jgi:hypothetical protein